MKKLNLSILVLSSALMCVPASAKTAKIVSDSKYPITIIPFSGENCQQEVLNLDASNLFKNLAKKVTEKDAAGVFNSVKSSIEGVAKSCKKGQNVVLQGGQSIDLEAFDTVFVATKIPSAEKKTVNPFPAVIVAEEAKTYTLKTRKSEKLRGVIGIAGDGGLTYEESGGMVLR